MTRRISAAIFLVLCASRAPAGIDVGSDGSDGAFNPVSDVTIDLSTAATASWDTPSPAAGQGVYDADEWAVVFKYSSVDIPVGVTVDFSNHPSGAPVVWLVQGACVIDGTINLDGADGSDQGEPPTHAVPSPGGFRGGSAHTTGTMVSGGFGPGGADEGGDNSSGTSGSYATLGEEGSSFPGDVGPTYGNFSILPLIGGSGGSGGSHLTSGAGGGGGAGGGAILIGADTSIALSGAILAQGGQGGSQSSFGDGGGGSGGAIRLIADQITGDGLLRASGGNSAGTAGGGAGRIRVEAITINLDDPGIPLFIPDLPTFVFPPVGSPKLRATMLDTEVVPADPAGDVTNPNVVDVVVGATGMITLEIEAENIPETTLVDARVVSTAGPATTFTSTPLADVGGGLLTATADVTLDPGFSVVQLYAFFGSGGGRVQQDRFGAALPRGLRDLRTLNGERIRRVEVGSVAGGATRVVYATETGRKIPVAAR